MSSSKNNLYYLESPNPDHPLGSTPLAVVNHQSYETEIRDDRLLAVTIGKEAIVQATLEHLATFLRERNAAVGVRALSMLDMLAENGVETLGFEDLQKRIANSVVEDSTPSLEVYTEALSLPDARHHIAAQMTELALRRSSSYAGEPLTHVEAAALATYDAAYQALFVPTKGFTTRDQAISSLADRYPGTEV